MNTYKLTILYTDTYGKNKRHFEVQAMNENDAENLAFNELTKEGFEPDLGMRVIIKKVEG